MSKKVSIIMGIYNCENTLSEAIESVLNQTYTNWELIMCDDCSTDSTYAIAKTYADNYENIILIKNDKNMKLAFSLNQCLKVATGEYIARMDADDLNLPERLQKQVKFLDAHPEYAVVGCRAIVFDENGDRGIRGKAGEADKKTLLKTTPFMHPTIMMRKSAYDALGGYTVCKRTARSEDLDLWFRFFANGYNGYVISDVLFKYHESYCDFKKRTIKAACGISKTSFYGFKLLNFPAYYYIYALKPIVSALIPNKIMAAYKKRR